MYILQLLIVLFANLTFFTKCIDTFTDISLDGKSVEIGTPIEFKISFTFVRNFSINEVVVLNFPKFYGQSTENVYISPSLKLRAEWV